MPRVDSAMLQSLAHAPLIGRYCDELHTFSATASVPAGSSGLQLAAWTVPSGQIAIMKLGFILCATTANAQQLSGGLYVNASFDPVWIEESDATLFNRATMSFDVAFPAGTMFTIRASNSDTSAKTFRCTILFEIHYI